MHLQEKSVFLLKGHTNVTQNPVHDVNYSATKFEVSTFNGLGGATFTRKYII